MYSHSLFLFRRDMRLADNTALTALAARSQKITVAYIFESGELEKKECNLFQLRFVCESLAELATAVADHGGALNVFEGDSGIIMADLISSRLFDAVGVNADYTPVSVATDEELARLCTRAGLAFERFHDSLLTEPGVVHTGGGKMFKMFTPFYRVACVVAVPRPRALPKALVLSNVLLPGAIKKIPTSVTRRFQDLGSSSVKGGRTAGLKALAHATTLSAYTSRRDFPCDETGTSHLSPHMAAGTVSVREVFYALQDELGIHAAPLIRSLYWRDFFTQVALDQPRVYTEAFNVAYKHLEWGNDESLFKAWKEGRTGFPLVDAGMRQLNETGYMHNRVRMVAASFLIKDLHIDWQWGEAYFAQKLVDYDPAVNNGNWQWCASTGCDSQPYFRIFNPWLQQKKFDPEAIYCKRWVKELAAATPAQIHAGYKKRISAYAAPLVDHAVAAKRALSLYKKSK